MNPAFLAKLQALQQQKQKAQTTTNAPRGVSLSSVNYTNDVQEMDYSDVLVIPPGLGKTKTDHFARLGAIVAENVDHDYPEDAFVIEPKKIIVAGSRGTALVKEMLLNNATQRVILFGPVHLRDFLSTAKANAPSVKILIVHGEKDPNERIETVRALVHEYKNQASLVEVDNQGHSLDIDPQKLDYLFRFSFCR